MFGKRPPIERLYTVIRGLEMVGNNELIESRVDYLTTTCNPEKIVHKKQAKIYREMGLDLIAAEYAKGNKKVPVSFGNYDGISCGSVQHLVSDKVQLIRLSGGTAATHWKTVHSESTNCSRIDLALTFRQTPYRPDTATKLERQAIKHRESHDSRRRIALTREIGRGATLYLGRRISDAFCRVYDKYRESKLEAYRDCWRFEVELKNNPAALLSSHIATYKNEHGPICAEVARRFARAGIRLGRGLGEGNYISTVATRSSLDKALCWLAIQTPKAVRRAIELDRGRELVEALRLTPDDLEYLLECSLTQRSNQHAAA